MATNLKALFIGVLIFGAIFAGMYNFLGELGDQYGIETDEEDRLAVYEETQDLSTQLNSDFSQLANESTSQTTQFFTGVNIVWQVSKSVISAPITVIDIIVDTAGEELGIPAWATGLILAIVTALIFFALLSALLRWKA